MKEERIVKEGLSEEVALSPNWKNKEKTSYEGNEEQRFQETAVGRAVSRNNLSTELNAGRRPVWPERGHQ